MITTAKKLTATILTLFVGLSYGFSQTTNNNNELNKRQKGLVAIAALTATGNQKLLELEMNKGLDGGLTINEAKEVLIQLAAYAGFPRSLNAINSLKKITEDRKAQGKIDEVGKEPRAMDTSVNRYELGKRNLEKLSGKPESGKAGYAMYVPVIEVFLKEHLFADIFNRGVLSYQDRELVTVSALTALGGVENQLQGHFSLSLTNGLKVGQLEEMLSVVEKLVGKKEAVAGKAVLYKVVSASNNK